MDIYIKSFNRPYLLHKTIASIYKLLLNFDGNIIVLDDGTPGIYLNKIKQIFPKVIIKKSEYYTQKSESIVNNQIPKKVIPASFWRNEIQKGTDFFILLEDDMWFCKTIDYNVLKQEVLSNKTDLVKFFWLKNNVLISENTKAKLSVLNIVSPKLFTQNTKLFNWIFKTNTFKLNSILRRLGFNLDSEFLKYYQIYIVAGGVFSKRFYETAWNLNQNQVDEFLQINQILNKKSEFVFANTNTEVVKATYKTTASLMNKESLGVTVNIFELNKILNENWLQNQVTYVNDFTEDIPTEWIKTSIQNYKNKTLTVTEWETWYEAFKNSYLKIGCEI